MVCRREHMVRNGSNVCFHAMCSPIALLTSHPDFKVTDKLQGVDFDLGNNFAGNIAVQRQGHPNDTLFFWAFEHQNGSLTASASNNNQPWAIWLQGGFVSCFGLVHPEFSFLFPLAPEPQVWWD